MAKISVTLELANTLKTIRLHQGIQAKDVAKYIDRTPAYISKLENGKINTIDEEVLNNILVYLAKNNTLEELTDIVLKTIDNQNQPIDKLEDQIWFMNFDTVYRRLPIPEKLIEYINKEIEANNIDISYLVDRINSNEALSDEDNNNDAIEPNKWYVTKNGNFPGIKMCISKEQVCDILSGETLFAPYVFVFCILFYIIKIEKYKNQTLLTFEKNTELMDETTQILNSYKFFNLVEKDKMLEKAETEEQLNEIWNSFDTENQQIISDILSGFKFASEMDIGVTNKRLEEFSQNMHWDLWFMLRIISLEYMKLDELSTTLKKEFIQDISKLIEKYSDLPKAQKTKETY